MDVEIVGDITVVEAIATGRGIRDLKRLRRSYGKGRWRKVKGMARVRLPSGDIRLAERRWYEAHDSAARAGWLHVRHRGTRVGHNAIVLMPHADPRQTDT